MRHMPLWTLLRTAAAVEENRREKTIIEMDGGGVWEYIEEPKRRNEIRKTKSKWWSNLSRYKLVHRTWWAARGRRRREWLMMVVFDWWLYDFSRTRWCSFASRRSPKGEHNTQHFFLTLSATWAALRWINELPFFIIREVSLALSSSLLARQTSNLMERHSDWKIPSRNFCRVEKFSGSQDVKYEKANSHRFRWQ